MKITDRQLAVLGLGVATLALVYGVLASFQNKKIIAHTEDIKQNLG